MIVFTINPPKSSNVNMCACIYLFIHSVQYCIINDYSRFPVIQLSSRKDVHKIGIFVKHEVSRIHFVADLWCIVFYSSRHFSGAYQLLLDRYVIYFTKFLVMFTEKLSQPILFSDMRLRKRFYKCTRANVKRQIGTIMHPRKHAMKGLMFSNKIQCFVD